MGYDIDAICAARTASEADPKNVAAGFITYSATRCGDGAMDGADRVRRDAEPLY